MLVKKHETLCVAGANGCGKSPLLHYSGLYKVGTGDISAPGCGMVFQDIDPQFFMPTVWEDVVFGILKKGTRPEAAREAAIEALQHGGRTPCRKTVL